MPPAKSRYPDQLVADRIEAKRKELEVTVAAAADVAGFSEWSWYKKADGTTPFKVEEIGRIAEAFKAPSGWPFIEWSAGQLLDRELGGGKR